jgi:hypothetical protein
MTRARTPIARVELARSLPRLLAAPFVSFAGAGAAIAAGLLVIQPPIGFGLVAVGGVLALVGLALMVVLLSVRLEVEESAVHVTWIGGGRVHLLSQGPVTRVRLSGPTASRLRVQSGVFGWGLGRAVLRDEERIEIVRLARTPTAILVPTDRGRLAIAPARDDVLLDALSKAAHARQRLEAQVAVAPEPEAEAAEPAEADAAAIAPSTTDATPPEIEAREVPEPRPVMTGIERAMLEEQLGREQAAAEIAAAAAAAEAVQAEAEPVTEVAPPPVAAAEPEVAAPEPSVRRLPRIGVQRPGARAAFVFLPLLGAGVAWGIGIATGRIPEPGSDLGRLTSLALVMAGPATSVGAIMAMAWWPRLVGVVVAGGLVASAFIGRALFGP